MQRVPVRIALPADEPLARLLRPGLSVTVTVDTRAEPDAGAPRSARRRLSRERSAERTAMTLARDAAARAPGAGPGRGPEAAARAAGTSRRTAARRRRPGPSPEPTWRDWIGVLAMVTGLFMAIMDVQIVSSSLNQIQGGLSATADEIAWLQTAYLIADVVMVPLSGTLSRLLSTRDHVRHRRARFHRRERACARPRRASTR